MHVNARISINISLIRIAALAHTRNPSELRKTTFQRSNTMQT